MKLPACTAVLAASVLVLSACGGSLRSATITVMRTDAIQVHETGYDALAPALRNYVHSLIASPVDGPIDEIDVYGPGSRAALVKATTGDFVSVPPSEQQKRFYLVVLHGQFVCGECTGPPGAGPRRGTIETHVWTRRPGSLDFGVLHSPPAGISSLHRLATIQLS